MVSVVAFALLVSLVAGQRLWEVRRSSKNEARLRRLGAIEHAPEQLTWMRLVHGAWLFSMIAEVVIFDRPFTPWVAIPAALVFVLGQALRQSAMRALGWRWNIRIFTLPRAEPVHRGIFAYVRHPNYLGVVLEIAALPLIHNAWITVLVFSAANAWLLRERIRAEEAALDATGAYREKLGDRPRFLPRLFQGSSPRGSLFRGSLFRGSRP